MLDESEISVPQIEEQIDDPHLTAKRQFFVAITVDLIYSFLKAILLILLFITASQVQVTSIKSTDYYARMKENIDLWQKQVIVEFQVTPTANCPQYFQQFTSDNWPGVQQGCLCSSLLGLFQYDLVFRGRCSEQEYGYGCSTVRQQEAIPFWFWQKGKHLCVRRESNYNFYTSFTDIINPNNYSSKICGEGQQYQMDLIEPIDCPISSLSTSKVLNQTLQWLNWTFSREDNYPIVDFKIEEYIFCEDYKKRGISPSRQTNYILQRQLKQQCSNSDPRTVEISKQNQIQFLEANPKIQETIQKLPAYPPPDQHFQYKLGFVRYPSWSYQCRQSNSFSLLISTNYFTLAQFNDFFTLSSSSLIFLLSFQCLYLVYYWFSLYSYHRQKQQQGYLYLTDFQIRKINKSSNVPRNLYIQLFKFIFMLIVSVSIIVITIVAYTEASDNQDWFMSVKNCTSQAIQSYIQGYYSYFGTIIIYALASMCLAVSIVLLDSVYLIWRRCNGDLQTQKQKQPQKNDLKLANLSKSQIQITQEYLVGNAGQTEGGEHSIKPDLLFELQDGEQSESSKYSSSQEQN